MTHIHSRSVYDQLDIPGSCSVHGISATDPFEPVDADHAFDPDHENAAPEQSVFLVHDPVRGWAVFELTCTFVIRMYSVHWWSADGTTTGFIDQAAWWPDLVTLIRSAGNHLDETNAPALALAMELLREQDTETANAELVLLTLSDPATARLLAAL